MEKQEIDKLRMQTRDMAEENFKKLAEMFPNAVSETIDNDGKIVRAIDADVLRQEISSAVVEGREERYQFTWPGKREAILLANTPITKTLRPCKKESVDFDNTQNLYIEGDNLDVLKLLQEPYLGKVKMIYIDPPYNTGNDFIYNDKFTQSQELFNESTGVLDEEGNRLFQNTESNGRFHSDWCSMIYPRLKLAKDLLSDDGVIFISIDDNEQENLKRVCDEIFGHGNFVTTLHIELSLTQGMKVGAAQNGAIVKNGEFVLVYSKNRSNFKVSTLLYDGVAGYDPHFSLWLEEVDNKLSLIPIGEFLERENKDINVFFARNKMPPTFASFCELIERDSEFRELIYKEYSSRIFRSMSASIKIPQNIQRQLEDGEVVRYEKYILHRVGTGVVRQLLPLSATLGITDDYEPTFGRRRIRGDMWKGFYADMMNVAKEGNVDFKNGKKPVRLIGQLSKWGSDKNSIVLDFFSGSATTAHAVMQLNAEDGGHRKFIMVQVPEKCDEGSEAAKAGFKTICEIGKERIRRAGKKILKENPSARGSLDVGFRVLKLDSSNMEDVYYDPASTKQGELSIVNVKTDRTSLDLLFQAMLEFDKPLSSKIEETKICGKTVFKVDGDDLICCFDEEISDELVTEIAKLKPLYAVFRDSSFNGDSVCVNCGPIFTKFSPATKYRII